MKKEIYTLTTEYIELIKLLKLLGIAETGSHAKMMVEQGQVKRNGEVESRKRAKLRARDVIEIKDWHIEIKG